VTSGAHITRSHLQAIAAESSVALSSGFRRLAGGYRINKASYASQAHVYLRVGKALPRVEHAKEMNFKYTWSISVRLSTYSDRSDIHDVEASVRGFRQRWTHCSASPNKKRIQHHCVNCLISELENIPNDKRLPSRNRSCYVCTQCRFSMIARSVGCNKLRGCDCPRKDVRERCQSIARRGGASSRAVLEPTIAQAMCTKPTGVLKSNGI
jgi:hypothetical protein